MIEGLLAGKSVVVTGAGSGRVIVYPGGAANAALFLACDLARTITGVNLPVDSGMTAGR